MVRRALVLLVLLAATACVRSDAPDGSDAARATRADLARIRAAVEIHRRQAGGLPRDALGLGAAVRLYAPAVPQRGGVPVDGWGRAFRYAPLAVPPDGSPGFSLWSLGPDGADDRGRGDDLGVGPDAPGSGLPEGARRALQLFPAAVIVALAPVAWGLLRWAKRQAS